MKYKQLVFVLAMSILPISKGYMNSPEKVFKDAITETEQGNYKKAIKLFESLLLSGSESAALYNNLGYCYFENKEYGLAILKFEKAILIDPNDSDIQHNLTASRQKLGFNQEPNSESTISIAFTYLYNFMRAKQLVSFGTILLTSGLLLLSINLYKPYKLLRYTGLVFTFSFLITLIVGFAQIYEKSRKNKAVVIEGPVDVLSAASNNAKQINLIKEGEMVLVLDNFEYWSKVQLYNGSKGWVPRKYLGFVKVL